MLQDHENFDPDAATGRGLSTEGRIEPAAMPASGVLAEAPAAEPVSTVGVSSHLRKPHRN